MTKKKGQETGFDYEKEMTAMKRRGELASYLGGEGGPLDAEEKNLVKNLGGPNAEMFRMQMLSAHRKGKVSAAMMGDGGPQSVEEEILASKLGGPNKDIYATQLLALHRRTKAMEWLSAEDTTEKD